MALIVIMKHGETVTRKYVRCWLGTMNPLIGCLLDRLDGGFCVCCHTELRNVGSQEMIEHPVAAKKMYTMALF